MNFDDPLVKTNPTINPYRTCTAEIIHRLSWDIHVQSWISRKRIRAVKNRNSGKKAVILCNGPSLNKVDFELLKGDCFTFGLNKINLLFQRSDFRPNCIASVNPYVLEQNREFFNETDIELYIDSIGLRNRWIRPRKNISFMHSTLLPGFAKDCSVSINQGHTVTFVALQLAFHMGFGEVALVGADHNFATKGPANLTVDGGDKDDSHFDPNYFSGVKWQLPDLFESEVAYGRARNIYEAHDRKIFNCTDGGSLEVFERKTLQDFIA